MSNPFSSQSNANDGTALPGFGANALTDAGTSQFSLTSADMFPTRGEALARYQAGKATQADMRVLQPLLSSMNTIFQ